MAFRFSRVVSGSGFFQQVRSLVNFLGLRRGSTSLKVIQPPLTYTRTWDGTPYLQKLAIDYLQKRPEYNPGWKTIIDNMCDRIKSGGYIDCTITKTHTWDQNAGPGNQHTVEYVVTLSSNLEGATNHPDLMSNYINELNEIFQDYKRSYEEANVSSVSSEEEWQVRGAALDQYRNSVEDLLSEID
jgi:hypothetical protein